MTVNDRKPRLKFATMPNLKESAAATLMAAALLLTPLSADANDLLRCGSRVVGPEALADEVRKVCGDPDYIDRWASAGAQLVGPLAGVEEWYYNFGPSQLLRVLHVQQGRVQEIRSEGYGFRVGGDHRCSPYDIVPGMTKYELVESCGEPQARQAEYVLRPLGGTKDLMLRHGLTQVFSEEWTYDFGSSNLMRVVTLENGRVTDVESGGRGHGAP